VLERASLQDLAKGARLEAILQAWPGALAREAVQVYSPDSEAAKPLAPMMKAVQGGIAKNASGSTTAHVLFLDSHRCVIAEASPEKSAPVASGIPRLKFPPSAPSRSTLKLEEAFLTLMSETERKASLKTGMTAVDLGACPGGWTYQLVRRGIKVTAIDNGKIDDALMRTGLVTHLRVDGFRFQPAKPVDWLVCDMVENPHKVSELVVKWMRQGWCQAAVVNLKLPMKKRFAALQQLQALWREQLGAKFDWRIKQLYYDREEVTALIKRNVNLTKR
jgi:23S rRNA (cytidine2498-2'-O)-methyltransferase